MGLRDSISFDPFNKKKLGRLSAHNQAIENELVAKRRHDEQVALQKREQEAAEQRAAQERARYAAERKAHERRQHDEEQRKMREASPEALRKLRELMRTRYELDVKIWARRDARRVNRHLVQDKMDRSDAVLAEIMRMVGAWGSNADRRWTEEEWAKVQLIRHKLETGVQRNWQTNPLWPKSG